MFFAININKVVTNYLKGGMMKKQARVEGDEASAVWLLNVQG